MKKIHRQIPGSESFEIDAVSAVLIKDMGNTGRKPVEVQAFGNCLPAVASIFLFDDTNHHVEDRLRICIKLDLHA